MRYYLDQKADAGSVPCSPPLPKPLALFVHAEAEKNNYGHLYVAFPLGWGLTKKGHQAVIEAGHVSEFRQGVETVV